MTPGGAALLTGAASVFGGFLGASIGEEFERRSRGVRNGAGWGAVIGTFTFGALAGAKAATDDSKPTGTLSGPRIGVLGATAKAMWFAPGDVWYIDFESNLPVTTEQFFKLVGSVQAEAPKIVPGVETATWLSFQPIDQQHFRAIVKWGVAGNYLNKGDAETIDGIRFRVASAGPYSAPTDEQKISTGKIVAVSAISALGLGGIFLAATSGKKKKNRRRSR